MTGLSPCEALVPFRAIFNPKSDFVTGIQAACLAPGMGDGMLKITLVESSTETVRLRAEGRLTGRWVEELRRTCELQALSAGIRLTVDLADVSFADTAGIDLLKELEIRSVTLLSPSSLVAEQLKP
jgi:hypothetical protein